MVVEEILIAKTPEGPKLIGDYWPRTIRVATALLEEARFGIASPWLDEQYGRLRFRVTNGWAEYVETNQEHNATTWTPTWVAYTLDGGELWQC